MTTPAITLPRPRTRHKFGRLPRGLRAWVLIGISIVLADSTVQAQGPSLTTGGPTGSLSSKNSESTDSAAYQRLILSALNAYEQGQWAKALHQFEQAHRLNPSSRTWRTIGMSAYNLGDFPRSISALEQALRDPRRPLSPEHRTQVQELIVRAYREVAKVDLLAKPEPDEVRVNGAPPFRAPDKSLLLPPGQHELTVYKAGYRSVLYTVSAVAGQRSQVTVHLPRSSGTIADTQEPAADGADTSEAYAPLELPQWQRTAGVIGLAVGATGLLASGITAALALDRRADLGKSCPNSACPPSQHDELAVYNRFKTVSTITFYGGLLSGAAGLTLLLIGPQGEAATTAPHASLHAGPTGLLLEGAL